MPQEPRILALDIGTSTIKAGEFSYPREGGIRLLSFACEEYREPLNDNNRSAVVGQLLAEMINTYGFTARQTHVNISGQAVLTKFVRLPPVGEEQSRIRQIVEFEARQNVPFPLEEVTWDYQLLSSPDAEELEVMFVVIKNDILEQITNAVLGAGLSLRLVDVASPSCYNCARVNHVGDQGCAMVLDIGCRSTNLLFADRNRFFSRTIPIAGHSVTQQISKEFGISFEEAEELKKRHGFVSLGGTYEEPESDVAAAVSKIVRNVMNRLHGEVNRSINVYRAQKGGNRPEAFYLTGGSSIMTYTDRFFAEKLRMDVQYLNPFQVVTLGENIEVGELQESAHMFSQVVGIALRKRSQCPVEVDLLPPSLRRQQGLQQKKYYLAASMVLVLLMLAVGVLTSQRAMTDYQAGVSELEGKKSKMDQYQEQMSELGGTIEDLETKYGKVRALLKQRLQWPAVLNEVSRQIPEQVWLDSVVPVAAEKESGRRRRDKPPSGGSGPGLFGPSSAQPSEKTTAASDATPSGKTVEVLKLQGHALVLDPDVLSGLNLGAGDRSADEEGRTSTEDFVQQTPDVALRENLRKSEMFSGAVFESNEVSRNIVHFVIKARLKEPMEWE